MAALAALALASCQSDDLGGQAPEAANGPMPLRLFASGGDTRVALGDTTYQASFDDGDVVGIFIVRQGTTLQQISAVGAGLHTPSATQPVWIKNLPFFFQAKDSSLIAKDASLRIEWPVEDDYDTQGTPYLVYAYFPYQGQLTITGAKPEAPIEAIPGVVPADQTNPDRYADMLFCKEHSAPRTGRVELSFKHALSLVEVKLNQRHLDSIGGTGHKVKLMQMKRSYAFDNFNAANGITASGQGEDIVMHQCAQNHDDSIGDNFRFRAFVPAQTLTKGIRHLSITNAEGDYGEFGGKTVKDITLHQGSYDMFDFSQLTRLENHNNPKTTINGMVMHEVRPGSFERNGHTVSITHYFQLSETEVTNAQFCQFLNANNVPSSGIWALAVNNLPQDKMPQRLEQNQLVWPNTAYGVQYSGGKWIPAAGKDNFPVVDVSWFGAKAFCLWLGGDLPTDAQWELACRKKDTNNPVTGISTDTYYWGNAMDNTKCWWGANSGNAPHAVKGKGANGNGLYDMAGNVYEWTADAYDPDFPTDDVQDPTGPTVRNIYYTASIRGGAYSTDDQHCTSAMRTGLANYGHYQYVGFRFCIK